MLFLKLPNVVAWTDWCRRSPYAGSPHQGGRLGGVLIQDNHSETAPLMPLSGTLAASADSRLVGRPVPVSRRDWRDGLLLKLRLSWMDLLRPFTSGRWEYPCCVYSAGIKEQIPASSWPCDVQRGGSAQRLSVGICGHVRRSFCRYAMLYNSSIQKEA